MNAQAPLHAVSNVIELKPGRRYLLICKGSGFTEDVVDQLARHLAARGIEAISLALTVEEEVTVIEAPGGTPA